MDTKEEFYKSFIDIQKKCGQGLSGIVRAMGGADIERWMVELMDEGLMKACDTGGSLGHSESNIFYMPTKGYNVWEDEDPKEYSRLKGRYLTHVRFYLGIAERQAELSRDKEFMEEYFKWLKRNEKELEIMINLDDFYVAKAVTFTTEEIAFIKTKKCFTENKNVAECIKAFIGGIEDAKENIEINTKIVKLQKRMVELGDKKSEAELKATEAELINIPKEITTRRKMISWLESQDKKEKIQTCFKF